MKLIQIFILLLFPVKSYCPWGLIDGYTNLGEKLNTWQIECYQNQLAIEETQDESTYPRMINGRYYASPWLVVNSLGAAGKWQLMYIARRDIGYKGTLKAFLHDPRLQKECIHKYMKRTKYLLDYYTIHRAYASLPVIDYRKYLGKKRFGANITLAGLIGASHLNGVGNTLLFLYNGHVSSDGHMTTKDYLKIFSKYEFKI
jgi:hypothetical protein